MSTLNKYGFVDDNSINEQYPVKTKATTPEFDSKPRYGTYNVQDGQGNWTERYGFSYFGDNEYYLEDYEARDITYY